MTNEIIESVRGSLGHAGQENVPPRPSIYPPRQPLSVNEELDRFFKELERLTGVGAQLNPLQLEESLKDLIAKRDVHKAAVWDTPFLKQLDITGKLHALGVEVFQPGIDKFTLAQCDLGITGADFLIPETGSVGLRASAEMPRAFSLLPPTHLVIASPAALRPDLHQVFAEAKHEPYFILITGPSRTSDIELIVTLGVHGPQSIYVWVIDEKSLQESPDR